jgi:hydrogenase maturation protease
MTRRLVIGVGNPDRGDDGAGREVVRRLRARGAASLELRECRGETTELMETWSGFDDVVLVDACLSAGAPGSLHRFSADEMPRLATLEHGSTHAFGVAAAIGLARALGTLPKQLVVYAIEARDSRPGEGLSPEVARAVDEVAALVVPDSSSARASTASSAGHAALRPASRATSRGSVGRPR